MKIILEKEEVEFLAGVVSRPLLYSYEKEYSYHKTAKILKRLNLIAVSEKKLLYATFFGQSAISKNMHQNYSIEIPLPTL